MLIIETPK